MSQDKPLAPFPWLVGFYVLQHGWNSTMCLHSSWETLVITAVLINLRKQQACKRRTEFLLQAGFCLTLQEQSLTFIRGIKSSKIRLFFLPANTVPSSPILIAGVLWNCFFYSQHSLPLTLLKSVSRTLLQSLKSLPMIFFYWAVLTFPELRFCFFHLLV